MAATGVTDAALPPAHLEAGEPPEARGLARDGVRLLVSRIDKAVQKGAIHRNTAARKKARAAVIVRGASQAQTPT